MAEPVFLKCTKSHFDKGKELKFVCLMEACRQNNLCCQECIRDYHEGHPKKQLKTLLSIGQYLKAKGPSKSQQSHNNTNRQALLKIVEQNQSKTMSTFKSLRQNINLTLDNIESNLEKYFRGLTQTIQKPHNKEDQVSLLEVTLNEISSSKDYNQTVNSIQNLLLLLNKVGKDGHLQQVQNRQDVLERLVYQSNMEIGELIDVKLTEIRNILSQSTNFIANSTSNAHNLWDNLLYNFTKELCHGQIRVQDSTTVVSGGDSIYQMALMQPQINTSGHNQVFRFKISKLTSNWIAVGVASKKVAEINQYLLDPYNITHGAFIISANGGSWAHQVAELNNKVRSFKFEEGDVITCIVDPESRKVYFVKESHVSELVANVKETFELSFAYFDYQDIHPCVVLHQLDNIVEYIPATNMSQIPKYDYLFSPTLKHPEIKVINNKSVMISEQYSDGYRSCLFNKAVEDDNWNSTKHFSFRISNCGQDWMGVGICHRQTASQKLYNFEYENEGHGYYMVSSNGGVWSSTDMDLNNKLACWKFKTGDVIECQVEFGDGPDSSNNQIVFKNGKHKYVLPFKCIPENKLYPCVMLHYAGDQVAVLPLF